MNLPAANDRFPIAEIDQLPADIRDKITAVQEKKRIRSQRVSEACASAR